MFSLRCSIVRLSRTRTSIQLESLSTLAPLTCNTVVVFIPLRTVPMPPSIGPLAVISRSVLVPGFPGAPLCTPFPFAGVFESLLGGDRAQTTGYTLLKLSIVALAIGPGSYTTTVLSVGLKLPLVSFSIGELDYTLPVTHPRFHGAHEGGAVLGEELGALIV